MKLSKITAFNIMEATFPDIENADQQAAQRLMNVLLSLDLVVRDSAQSILEENIINQ